MTPTEIIGIVDRVTPNAFDSEDKLRWLTQLDAELRAELFLDTPGETDRDGALVIPAPWAEEIYTAYLQACMAWADEEDARYDRFILRFNDAYQRYARMLMDERVRHPAKSFAF